MQFYKIVCGIELVVVEFLVLPALTVVRVQAKNAVANAITGLSGFPL